MMNPELKIDGMSCDHCVAAVRKALEAVPGVTSAEVSLPEGRALVHGDADLEALVGAVEEEGYAASPVAA